MKKQFLFGLVLVAFCWLPSSLFAQTTEGTDFWVTFLQADQGGADFSLDLAISSRYNCKVTISNPYTGYTEDIIVLPNITRNVNLDASGSGAGTNAARTRQTNSKKICYAFNSEQVDTCALHIVSDSAISLFASNYQYASFDATNVLPTSSLQDEYIIQTYSPSDNGGDGSSQGSHFAIVATENNVVVDITPTAWTQKNHKSGETFATDTLQMGQVYYVWTGKGVVGEIGDLSGTHVKARDGKKIAVFQGCPHTNIPHKVKLRDHIYSQAMPTKTWGNSFVITASNGRKRDIYRLYAMNDETNVYFGDSLAHTFKFVENKPSSHYWEFELGEDYGSLAKPDFYGTSCFIHTSCPCALHQFMVSQQYDGDSKNNGDPAMLWINPIEQQINQITFTTYPSQKGETANNVNIVTANPEGITLNGENIKSEFQRVANDTLYWFARHSLGKEIKSYTLKNDSGNFIAHVYGFTKNESYAYSAGGYVKSLTQYITINGKIFTPDSKNTLCGGEEPISFACHPDYEYEKIEWYFGDGTSNLANKDSVLHKYPQDGVYPAYVLIYRNSSNVCVGQNAVDSIPITVNIGSYKVDIAKTHMPDCTRKGDEVDYLIYLDNPAFVKLDPQENDSVQFTFNQKAIDDHFTDQSISFEGDTLLIVHLPKEANDGVEYGLRLHIGSECPDAVLDKDLNFSLKFAKPVLVQRYDNVLGLVKDSFPNQTLSNFVWFHDGDTVKGQETSVLYLDEQNPDNVGEYKVCYTIHEEGKPDIEDCTCPVHFETASNVRTFDTDENSLVISATYTPRGHKVFVNAKWGEKTKFEDCYAEWLDVSGRVWQEKKFNLPDGGCTIDTPTESGFYILRVKTDGGSRSFKMFID